MGAPPSNRQLTSSPQVVYIQDFPQQTSATGKALPSGYNAAFENETHTHFSSDLVRFLFKDLGIPTLSEYKTFVEPFSRIDFSASSKVS